MKYSLGILALGLSLAGGQAARADVIDEAVSNIQQALEEAWPTGKADTDSERRSSAVGADGGNRQYDNQRRQLEARQQQIDDRQRQLDREQRQLDDEYRRLEDEYDR
ncbi:DDRRRQL repeat protein YjdP [Entomohabitans teleogrylli]|uniref:DDRRRQL repeat protein YjdP n=1 Tax=Entomohabitans teleogrylli TaxID=1384589 RepID=UPI00073D1E28|nr:DDRRRQL repeat protein YjdP [Entomohabitans teleogrylli]